MPDIKQVRTALKVTQVELAALLDVDQSTISRMENGTLAIDKRTELALEAIVARSSNEASREQAAA